MRNKTKTAPKLPLMILACVAGKGIFDRKGLDPSLFGAYDRKGYRIADLVLAAADQIEAQRKFVGR